MKFFLNHIILIIFGVLLASPVMGQTIEEKREQADEHFKEREWAEAEKLYASVIADSPRDHDLNFRYGTSLLYASKDKDEAIRRLRYAITGANIDKRSYYYLGQAYHLNYQFGDAAKYYKKFEELATPSDLKQINVEADLKACKFGKQLLSNITDMVVLQKTELREDNFYDLYKLDDIGGTLLVTDQFQSKLDKKRGHRPVIHFPSNSPYIYYSSYGEDGATGLDIYVIQRLPGGEWSLARKVKGNVNTELDEDFAYMHPNGNYLYFCSKGHNSMGGYDVFRSRYNPDDQSFGTPENLDFAISSPDDDLLFVVDSLDKVAYFSSRRESGAGKLTVYKVRVDRIPMQMAVIKGNFLNTIDESEKEVIVEVEDISSGRVIGTFNSKKTNGDYLITFPKSGKYRFIITPKDSDISHLYEVDVPYMKDFRPLKQSMTLVLGEDNNEYIQVKDQFNEAFDDPVAIMAEVYREMSKLPENVGDFNIDSLDALKETDGVFVDAGLDPYTTKNGLEDIVSSEIKDLEEANEAARKQVNVAINLANEKAALAEGKLAAVNAMLDQIMGMDPSPEKTRMVQNVMREKQQAEQLAEEAKSLLQLAETIEKSISDREKLITESEQVLAEVKAIPEGDRTALTNVISKNTTYFQDNIKGNPPVYDPVTEALTAGTSEQKKVQEFSEEISRLSKEKRALESENERLEKQMAAEKKQKVKDELQRQIDGNLATIDVLDRDIAAKTTQLDDIMNTNDGVRVGIAAAYILEDVYADSPYEKNVDPIKRREIEAKVKYNDFTKKIEKIDATLEENEISSFDIDLYATTDENSTYTLEKWNEEIDSEIERLRQERLMASKEKQAKIDAEIERLERLRAEKEGQYEVVEEVDPESIKPEINPDDIVPNYSGQKTTIGEIVDEEERRKAELALADRVLEEVQTEKRKLEQILEDNPDAKNVQKRLDNLEGIEEDLTKDKKANEEWILANGDTDFVTRETAIENIDSDYQRKVSEAYEIVDEAERNKAVNDLNVVVEERANERIQELNAIIESDPENQKAKNELEIVEEIVREINQNQGTPLVEPKLLNAEELSAKVTPGDFVRNYDSRKKVVDGIKDDYTRRQEQNKLYEEVVSEAARHEGQLTNEIRENPDTKNLAKRKTSTENLRAEFEEDIEKNKEWLANNKPEEMEYADRKVVRMVYPEYQAEIDRINEIEDFNDRAEAIKELNKNTEEAIKEKLESIDQTLKENPESRVAEYEQRTMNGLLDDLSKNREMPLLAPTSEENIVASITEEDLVPNYENKKSEINLSGRSPEEQKAARIELNQDLLKTIDQELARNEELKTRFPEQTDVLDSRAETLNALKTKTENEIAEDGGGVDAQLATNRPEITIESLMPTYPSDLLEIRNSNEAEVEKLTAENELTQMLVAALDWKYGKLKEERDQNPELADAIGVEMQKIATLKKEKQAEISANRERIEELKQAPDLAENRSEISVDLLMPDYAAQLTALQTSGLSEIEQLKAENELHTSFISTAEDKIAALETEKINSPDLTAVIDTEIATIQGLISQKKSEISSNDARIDTLETEVDNTAENQVENRAEISIGTLMPDYTDRLESIRSNDQEEKEQLEAENELHQELIDILEAKEDALTAEENTNPDLQATIAEEQNAVNQIKQAKEAEIQSNTDRINALNTETDNTQAARPTISVGALMRDYDDELDAIRDGEGTAIEKLEKENELLNNLLSIIDTREEELKAELENNPASAAEINEDIDKIQDLRRKTLNNIQINKDQITSLQAGNLNRPEITIGSLIPDFDEKMQNIESSDLTEEEKLIEKNKLNKQLISAITRKTEDIQEEWEEDPSNGFTYGQEIDKLEELLESKKNEIARNEEELEQLAGTTANVASIDPENFRTRTAQETISEVGDELNEINELTTDLDALKTERDATNDEKAKAKLTKEIEKLTEDKAELENEVIVAMEGAMQEEIKETESEMESSRAIASTTTSNNTTLSEEVEQANRDLVAADQKLRQAIQLREEAEDEKDPVAANVKLTEAYQLENEAKELKEKAARIFRMARSVSDENASNETLTSVDEVPENRASAQAMEEAEVLRTQADEFYQRANSLRDSAETVKKKNREAIRTEADAYEAKGDELNAAAVGAEEKAEALAAQEEELLSAQLDQRSTALSEEDRETVGTSEVYENFYSAKKEGDEKMAAAEEIDEEIEALQTKRVRKFRNAISMNESTTNLAEADSDFAEMEEQLDSLNALKRQLRDEALASYRTAQGILNENNQDAQDAMLTLATAEVEPFERKANPSEADYVAPEELNIDIFRRTDQAVYSEAAPIPVDQNRTSGLVYKIQVGAFRNPLPQDHFNQFAPISGEKLRNGITRYMVGYFTTFNTADSSKNEVRDLGYSDAFVVAYCNGERITTDRAQLIEQGLIKCESTEAVGDENLIITESDNQNNTNTDNTSENSTNNTEGENSQENTTDNTTTDNATTNNTDTESNNTENTTETNTTETTTYQDQSENLDFTPRTDEEREMTSYYNDPNAADANQVEIIKGLFYTVQIGVYSKPVPNKALFNIEPLNSQRAPNGYIRYSTGIFTSVEEAEVRKNEVVNIGVSDAFVTAYFNGERITPEEALRLLQENGADILVGRTKEEIPTDTTTEEFRETFYQEGLYYRILLGKYDEAIPGEYATLLLQMNDVFETEVDQDGRTCIITRKQENYDQLQDELIELVDLGIEDMEIITYYKYDVIPFEEGEKIRKNEDIEQLHPYDEIQGISANPFIYVKEAVYFRIKLGEFEEKVPTEFTNLLLLYEEEEGIEREVDIDNNVSYFSRNYRSYEEAQAALERLKENGFGNARIKAYHKYDEISIGKALEILEIEQ